MNHAPLTKITHAGNQGHIKLMGEIYTSKPDKTLPLHEQHVDMCQRFLDSMLTRSMYTLHSAYLSSDKLEAVHILHMHEGEAVVTEISPIVEMAATSEEAASEELIPF